MSERLRAGDIVDSQELRRAAKRIASLGHEAHQRARRLGETRPELVAYVLSATSTLSTLARNAAWHGLELVCEAMQATERPRSTLADLFAAERANDALALSLGVAHPRMADRYLQHGAGLRQRALLLRLAQDAIAEAPSGERGAVFLVLKTVVDVLDRPA